jgi:hypothetical protein
VHEEAVGGGGEGAGTAPVWPTFHSGQLNSYPHVHNELGLGPVLGISHNG